jgi:hypothetical protein
MFKIPIFDRSYYFFAHPYRLYGVNIMKIQAIENLTLGTMKRLSCMEAALKAFWDHARKRFENL